MVAVQLNLCLKEGQCDFVSMDIKPSDKLEVLKAEAAKRSNMSSSEIMLLYCGALLKDTDTVEEVGLVPGDCIHCLRSKEQRIDEATPLTTVEVHELHRELSRVMRGRNKSTFFAQLQQNGPAFWKTAVSKVSGGWQDPDAALALQDPVLLYNYYKDTPDNLVEVTKQRPVLGRLLQLLLETCKKEWTATASTTVPPSAYSLDVLYEPDEDDHHVRTRSSDNSGASGGGSSRSSDASQLPAITPAQLAAALANASGTGNNQGAPYFPSLQPPQRGGHPSIPATPSNTPASASATPASHTSNTPSSASHTPASASASTPHQMQQQNLPHITSEMLNSALQSVLGASSGGGTSPNTASSPRPSSATPSTAATLGSAANIPNMEESLRLMQEMGIPDEGLSRQALVMTNGDVEAAVQLVFAQLNMFD